MRIAIKPLAASLLFAMACGGAPSPRQEQSPEEIALRRLNEEARQGAVVEELHGVRVADPYRRLEEDSEFTTRWVSAQNARTEGAFVEDAGRQARLEQLFAIGSIGDVQVAGERVFFEIREGEREQPVLMLQQLGQDDRVVVDPTEFGERAALDWFYPSPDGSRIAFGISNNGDERSVLHLREIAPDGQISSSELRIPRTKWSTVAWLPDGAGFYYTRYPNPGEPDFDAENEDTYFPRVFFHSIGSDPAADPLVFGAPEPSDFPSPQVSEDGRWVMLSTFQGWSKNEVRFFERSDTQPVPSEQHPLRELFVGQEARLHGEMHDGLFYAFTDLEAPKGRIVAIDPEAPGTDRWREVIAEGEDTIEDFVVAGGDLVLHYIEDIASTLRRYEASGTLRGELALPARGRVSGLTSDIGSGRIAFSFSGYLAAPRVQLLGADGELLFERAVACDVDLDGLTERLVHVTSADGTEVPVTLVHREDLPLDGSSRALLYGYGGFNISLLPNFARNALYWIEQGGVYAVANLRGGGELGEQWHRDGMLGNKEHVFEDFEAVIAWLAQSGISSPDRIAITGGSNGGLLMGAMITRHPERFAAAATYVGLYDMVRYHLFPPAQLWISEYGSPEEPAELAYLHAYSPYHRVRPNTAYPHVLIETADHDSRVHWAHSTKFAAALQEANAADTDIFFSMQRAQGHGAGTRLSDVVRRYERLYSFLDRSLAGGDAVQSSAAAAN